MYPKVTFLNTPKYKNISEYHKCGFTLYLLNCSYVKYELLEDMIVQIEFEDKTDIITVKKGFICDGASVPRLFWGLYPPDGKYTYSAILHDMLYQSDSYNRKINDSILKNGMHDGVPNDIRNIFYYGVRLGGWTIYSERTQETIGSAKNYIDIKIY